MASGEMFVRTRARTLHATTLILFSPTTLQFASTHDLATANAVISCMRRVHTASLELLSENVLWSLRQRVARHLLDLASISDPADHVSATVQDLADATGTVREVVTRLLSDMRRQGLVARREKELVITDVIGLRRVVHGH
jgi:CRP-like cAMP-binding protein